MDLGTLFTHLGTIFTSMTPMGLDAVNTKCFLFYTLQFIKKHYWKNITAL